jgi:hypothetical protein
MPLGMAVFGDPPPRLGTLTIDLGWFYGHEPQGEEMRKAIMPAAAVMALLAIGDTASAQPKFDSKVTIHAELAKGGVQRFFGEVKSGKNACEPNRKVVLYHTLTGNP